jgi:hypothetical protein
LALTSPNGDAAVDTLIANTLAVAALPYTSNDVNAQTLLPSGWSWISATRCSRNVDSVTLSSATLRSDGGIALAPLTRCLGALKARVIEAGGVIA